MIRKIKHPSGRGERLAIKAKKDKKLPDNSSAVYRLLSERSSRLATLDKEKELLDEDSSRLPRDRDSS